MAEVARIRTTFVDWNAIKSALDTKTCLRHEHPQCNYHYTEAQAFKRLSREISESKKSIEILREYRRSVSEAKLEARPCELHWIKDCAICSPLARIDRSIRIAQRQLGKLRFQLISLPTVAEALGRKAESKSDAIVVPHMETKSPVERIYGGIRAGNATPRLRHSDIQDNIRLIESWLKGRQLMIDATDKPLA